MKGRVSAMDVRRPAKRDAETSPADTIALLRDAIRDKEQVVAFYRDRLTIFCPHVLASGPDAVHVLAFVLIGELESFDEEFTSPKRWRWIRAADLKSAMRRPGAWFSAPRATAPPLAGTRVTAEAR
ncbi:MAG: hypothetical protein ACE147_13170 [Candidatus Methylomirabilales bacterium]